METVVISLEDLIDLVSGRLITCGPIEIRIAQDDLDGLVVFQALCDVSPILGRLRDLDKFDE